MLFGVGRYTVTVELQRTAGLYPKANVTYRGTEVGEVKSVHLTRTGVRAVLSLRSGISIPSDLEAQVHSQSAIGEQYVELRAAQCRRSAAEGTVTSSPLTTRSVPPDIDSLLDATNRGLPPSRTTI